MKRLAKVHVFLIIVVLCVVIICHHGCKKEEPQVKEIKIGAIMPLTGGDADYGESLRSGMELAVNEINTKGDRQYKIVFEDDQGTVTGAVNALRKLINSDKVKIVLGPAFSGQALACAPIAQPREVLLITTLPGTPELKHAGDFVFRVYASDEYQGKYIADVVLDQLNQKEAAVLRVDSAYGKGLAEAIKGEFTRRGGRILVEEVFQGDQKDVRTQLQKIKQVDAEVVFAPCLYQDAAVLLVQAKQLGIDSFFIGGDAWNGDIGQQIRGAEDLALFSSLVLNEDNTTTRKFLDEYKRTYGRVPNTHVAAGYDAVYLAKHALDCGGASTRAMRDCLYKLHDFGGALGKIEFDSYGDNISLQFGLFKFDNGMIRRIEPGELHE